MEMWTGLALSARNGDRRELEAFVDVTYGPTRRLCAALVDEASADDLAQETFLQVAKGIRRFRAESSGRTWLFSIAHHVCASELRNRVRRRRHTEPDGSVDLADVRAVDNTADDLAVNDLLRHLSPERRAAFALTQLYGISYEETAAICRCAPGTIGSRVTRAREDLIRILDADRRSEEGGTDWPGETDTVPPIGDLRT